MIRAVLVDDEEPARDRLRGLLEAFDDVTVVGEARDGEEALKIAGVERPDLLFLDIQMPGLTGLQVAATLAPPRPHVIFCTAYDRYAIDAFEHYATDYLLKPVNRQRLGRAVQRVRDDLEQRRLETEDVVEASRTQARLLPQELPPMRSLDYAGACRAAQGVGGDYYDFLALGAGRLGIALGDISGKGLFAGLLVAGLQARIQSLAPRQGEALDRLVGEINRLLCAALDSNRYATLFYGQYDDATRSLRYVNAGHNPPLLFRAGASAGCGERVERLKPNGTVVGLLPDARYREQAVRLEQGDWLVAFSDGVTEARNARQEEFGEERLISLVVAHAGLSAARLLEEILAELDRFGGSMPQHDDLTLVVAKGVGRR